jgi:hypothetical protein
MKSLTFLLISLILWNDIIAQQLIIKIKVDTCIDVNKMNKVEFLVENNNNFDCVVKTEYLPFYFGVYSVTGEIVHRKTSRHNNIVGYNEYVTIDKNSSKVIPWLADFWGNLQFKLNQEYYIEATYEYSYLTKEEKRKFKKSLVKLVKSKNSGRSNFFRICNL